MKFQTTAILMIVLIALLAWVLWDRPGQNAETPPAAPTSLRTAAEQSLFDPAPKNDDVVEVTVTRHDVLVSPEPPDAPGAESSAAGQTWRFEKVVAAGATSGSPAAADTQDEWRMVEPFQSAVPRYEVDNIIRTVSELKYQIKHVSGEAGAVTPDSAGLEPPRFEVALKDKQGKRYSIKVGRPVTESETYVRRDDEKDIYVVRRSLSSLVKKNVDEYRDRAMVKFTPDEAVALTVRYRSGDAPADAPAVEYRLAKHNGGDWVFESPFNADANDQNVKNVVSAASRLRATEWVPADPTHGYGRFGLQTPKVEVEITTESKVPVESESDNPETTASTGEEKPADSESGESESTNTEPAEQIKTERFAFAVSGRGPLGKDQSVYARLENDGGVALIAKSVADKFTPDVEKWRNMDILTASVTGATGIRIAAGGEKADLVKDEAGAWTFADGGARAGKDAVEELIKTLNDLNALNFVDDADPADPQFGLTPPRTEISLTLPGRDQPERVAVGNPTDDVSKRVYYLRRGDSTSIAKVRADEVAVLDRKPSDYLDKEIINVAASRMQRIDLVRPNADRGTSESLTLANASGAWRLTQPIDAPTDDTTVAKLIATLATLRADRVVSPAGDAAAYGLDDPAVRVTVTHEGPETIQADAEDVGEPTPPPSETIELVVAERGHDCFARRSNNPTIYLLRRADYQSLLADFHNKTVMNFQQSQATSVAVTSASGLLQFDKKDEGWVYAAEPDLPIDPNKVTDLLVKLQDLKLKRYVAYQVDDLAAFGFDSPQKTAAVVTDEGRSIRLLVSAKTCPGEADHGVYAVIDGTRDVFILTPGAVSALDISLDEFEKADDS